MFGFYNGANMRNIFSALVLFILIMSIIGCTNNILINKNTIKEIRKDIRKDISKDISVEKWQNTVKTFGGTWTDIGNSCTVCKDGSILIVGVTNSRDGDLPNRTFYPELIRKKEYKLSATDLWVLKVDPQDGRILYNQCFGGSGDDAGFSIVETADENIIVIGTTDSIDGDLVDIPRESKYNLWLLKIDPRKNKIIYNKLIGGMYPVGLDIHANSLIETSDGNIAITAQVNTEKYSEPLVPEATNKTELAPKTKKGDLWVLKVDLQNDKIMYSKCFGGWETDGGVAIMESEDKNLVVVGNTRSRDGDVVKPSKYRGSDIWVLKIDPCENKILYNKCFGGLFDDVAASAVKCRDGSILISGSTKSMDGHLSGKRGTSREQARYDNLPVTWVIKINIEKDTILYNECFNETDEGISVVETKDGCVFLAEITINTFEGRHIKEDKSLLVRKINLNTDEIFYKSSFDASARAIAETQDGRIVVVGPSVEEEKRRDIFSNVVGKSDLWYLTISPILEEFDSPKK